ncbi:MAG TPA: PPC domain-containing DNA-binding protein, partial [Opitutaceae bacterium]|nr:PPC domain-containing DNA-binding protein [Opitutaceae bacterium]
EQTLMKTVLLLVLLALCADYLPAAETRTEITKATTPAEDSKPNSPSVPDVVAIDGKFERVVILRFKYQADLLAGLEQGVKEQKIRNGVILSAIGSVRSYHYHTVSNRTFPSKNIFVKNLEATADIISMNGYVLDGRLHPHITFSTPERSFGGHLEPGTEVFTFAVVTIGVLADALDLKRLDDKTYR